MSKTSTVLTGVAVLAVLAWAGPAGAAAKSAAEVLQEGIYAEEIEGNLDKAVTLFDQVIEAKTSGRSYVAQAMYRKGMCFLKKRDEQAARSTLERLLAEFADQTAIIDKARAVLEDLTVVDLASLMPPQTLMYVELGSPGRQIETILNMLKGTPFENPLAAVAGAQAQGQGGAHGPVLSSLFNPSMMAEFKKIRGMAAGITGITQNQPPFVVVLYPGKSDALRGMLLAVLGMAGKQIDPIEGMESFNIQNSAYAAHDDNVIIIAHPLDQLKWSVKRHKGIIKEPSLATSSGSFSRLGKDVRQGNALTLWANVDQAYAGVSRLVPKGQMPQELRMADGFVDFNSIDDLTVQLAVKEQGLSLEADVNFKDGHRCLAYDLIRTPNLSRAAFEAVPSEAIALASFALADPQSAQAKAVSERLQRVTGLDVEREIYGNFEQVSLFVVPPTQILQEPPGLPPIAGCVGLSITSHDPQRTRQVLSTLLGVVHLISDTQQAQPSETAAGRYLIGVTNGKPQYCYMNQAGKSTILSLNPAIMESAIRAQKTGSSVCKAGPLSKAVQAMAPSTSKVVLVNHGGAVRMIGAHVPFPAEADEARQAVEQLAQACEKTLIQVSVNEQPNQFSLKAGLDNLPPLSQVIGPVTVLNKAMQSRQQAWSGGGETTRSTVTCEVTQAVDKPVMDGKVEVVWAPAKTYELKSSLYKPVSGPEDCSASFRTLWDQDNLYVLVEVQDEDLRNDSPESWLDDCVEVFIDADNSKSDSYDDDDYHYYFGWDARRPVVEETSHQKTQDVRHVLTAVDEGYCLEVSFPWATLGAKPSAGSSIGLDVQVNDDDGGGDRDSKIAWSATEDNAYQNPSVFGNASFPGLVAWWKLDEKEGSTAADASGNGHDGTLQGNPQWQPTGGKVGGALDLDGDEDCVETGFSTDLACWTAVVWVKSPAAPGSDNHSGPVHREKNLQINWNHSVDAYRGGAGVCIGGNWYGARFGDLQADTWVHLAATYDGEDLKAYKDGVLISANPDPSGPPDSEQSTLKLGRHSTKGECFQGTIDDVRIYNTALAEAEVRGLYEAGQP